MSPALANRRGDGKQHKYIQHSDTETYKKLQTTKKQLTAEWREAKALEK
jgi:hypothetical protein